MRRLIVIYQLWLVVLIPSASVASGWAVESPAGPITIAPGCSYSKDYAVKARAWAEKHLVGPAKTFWKDKDWGPKAEAYCHEALDAEFSKSWRNGLSLADLAGDAQGFGKTGCDDALTYFFVHRAIYEKTRDWRKAERGLDLAEAVAGARTETPGALICMILQARRTETKERGELLASFDFDLADAIIRSLGDGSYDEESAQVAVRQVGALLENWRQFDDSFAEKFATALNTSSLPEWARLALIGNAEMQKAWNERGDFLAVNVTNQGWKGFAEHLLLAKEALEKSWTLHPECPEAASTMIAVSMGLNEGLATSRKWFDRSITAEFDYVDAYNRMFWAMRPRWGGSLGMMLRFGKACANTRRYDTWVPHFVWQACEWVSSEIESQDASFNDRAMRKAVIETAEGYLNSKAFTPSLHYMAVSRAAVAAWMAHDDALAARALEEVGAKLEKGALAELLTMGHHEDELRTKVKARTGAYGQAVAQIAEAAVFGDTQKHQKLLGEIELAKLSGEAKSFVDQELDHGSYLNKLSTGDWVPVVFRPGLTHCIIASGQWAADDSGALIGVGCYEPWAKLLFGVPVEGKVEVRGEVTVDAPKDCVVKNCYGGGALIGWAPTTGQRFQNAIHAVLLHYPLGENRALIAGSGVMDAPPIIEFNLSAKNSFHLIRADGQFQMTVNGKPVPNELSVRALGSGEQPGLIGLCVERLPFGATARFSNVEMRGIPAAEGH